MDGLLVRTELLHQNVPSVELHVRTFSMFCWEGVVYTWLVLQYNAGPAISLQAVKHASWKHHFGSVSVESCISISIFRLTGRSVQHIKVAEGVFVSARMARLLTNPAPDAAEKVQFHEMFWGVPHDALAPPTCTMMHRDSAWAAFSSLKKQCS